MRYRYFLLFYLCIFIVPFKGTCNHIIGGSIGYTYLGNNQYRITLLVYRDCSPGMAAFDDPASVGVFNSAGGLMFGLSLHNPAIVNINPAISNPCLQVPPNVCVQQATYIKGTTLYPIPGGYLLVYQRCCRNTSITNIYDPGNTGASYVIAVPDRSKYGDNSSPTFENYPPVVICQGQPIVFDHHATDPDGDRLVYSLCSPSQGADQNAPMPVPPNPPPYPDVIWQNSFSATNPLGGSKPLAIDSTTGLLTGYPASIGQFVVGICVEEYRNGQLLSETKRDFQFNVTVCHPNVTASFGISEGIVKKDTIISCGKRTINFINQSTGNTAEKWNFGELISQTDSSSLSNPVHTYAQNGTYKVVLIVNPGTQCSDTVIKIIKIENAIETSFSSLAACASNPTSFIVSSASPDAVITSWNWSFGDGQTSAQKNPSHDYHVGGSYSVKLIAKDNYGCTDTSSKEVTIYALQAISVSQDTAICKVDSVRLKAIANNVRYAWNPTNTLNNPVIANPVARPKATTTYTVTVTDNNGCVSKDSIKVTVVDTVMATSGTDTTVCLGKPVPLYSKNAVYYRWFPADGLSDAEIANPIATPSHSTSYTVVSYIGSCFDMNTVVVNVLPLPTPYAGENATINQGQSTQLTGSGGTTYLWRPEQHIDNNTISSPEVTPLNTTTYTVTVSLQNGCAASDSVVITVTHIHELFVPNAFSPNNDGVNDYFHFYTKGIQKIISVRIFNRWGQTVYDADGSLRNDWDGTFNGTPLPIGTYVYLIEAETFDGDVIQKKGDLTLIR